MFQAGRFLSLSFASLLVLWGLAKPQSLPDVSAETAAEFFIGQAYPSGNVYLKSFFNNRAANWPSSISVIAVADVRPQLLAAQPVRFGEAVLDRQVGDQLRSLYIPGAEGMDSLHRACGLGAVVSANSTHTEVREDFFRTVSDHCEPNAGVARYRGAPSSHSFMVFGVTDRFSVASTAILNGKVERPLSPSESERVRLEKAAAAKAADCTTEAAFLDSARQLLEGSLGAGLRFRLSTYANPGCAGHLVQIYILDLIRDGSVVQTYRLSQYRGAL